MESATSLGGTHPFPPQSALWPLCDLRVLCVPSDFALSPPFALSRFRRVGFGRFAATARTRRRRAPAAPARLPCRRQPTVLPPRGWGTSHVSAGGGTARGGGGSRGARRGFRRGGTSTRCCCAPAP